MRPNLHLSLLWKNGNSFSETVLGQFFFKWSAFIFTIMLKMYYALNENLFSRKSFGESFLSGRRLYSQECWYLITLQIENLISENTFERCFFNQLPFIFTWMLISFHNGIGDCFYFYFALFMFVRWEVISYLTNENYVKVQAECLHYILSTLLKKLQYYLRRQGLWTYSCRLTHLQF